METVLSGSAPEHRGPTRVAGLSLPRHPRHRPRPKIGGSEGAVLITDGGDNQVNEHGVSTHRDKGLCVMDEFQRQAPARMRAMLSGQISHRTSIVASSLIPNSVPSTHWADIHEKESVAKVSSASLGQTEMLQVGEVGSTGVENRAAEYQTNLNNPIVQEQTNLNNVTEQEQKRADLESLSTNDSIATASPSSTWTGKKATGRLGSKLQLYLLTKATGMTRQETDSVKPHQISPVRSTSPIKTQDIPWLQNSLTKTLGSEDSVQLESSGVSGEEDTKSGDVSMDRMDEWASCEESPSSCSASEEVGRHSVAKQSILRPEPKLADDEEKMQSAAHSTCTMPSGADDEEKMQSAAHHTYTMPSGTGRKVREVQPVAPVSYMKVKLPSQGEVTLMSAEWDNLMAVFGMLNERNAELIGSGTRSEDLLDEMGKQMGVSITMYRLHTLPAGGRYSAQELVNLSTQPLARLAPSNWDCVIRRFEREGMDYILLPEEKVRHFEPSDRRLPNSGGIFRSWTRDRPMMLQESGGEPGQRPKGFGRFEDGDQDENGNNTGTTERSRYRSLARDRSLDESVTGGVTLDNRIEGEVNVKAVTGGWKGFGCPPVSGYYNKLKEETR